MSALEAATRRLVTRRLELAGKLLDQPLGATSFDYGKACGIMSGYQLAINDLHEELAAEAAREAQL